jgi:catechol 2,3-dioxygenase-like lactoylglutathione lyase family enzyme
MVQGRRIVLSVGMLLGCGGAVVEEEGVAPPQIMASNSFYYYEDVPAAEAFYNDVLGLETVSDFGFAKILQVAPTSFLTLVDHTEGQHTSAEPKSVTLAIVTEQVQEWYNHLNSQNVPIRNPPRFVEGSAHDGFVATDPEGYFLEFEWFNEHEENERFSPILNQSEPLTVGVGDGLTISATVWWLYYDELAPIQDFYERVFNAEMIVDQGWAKVYPISTTGYVGFVDGARGLHQATEQKAVTMSFLTDDVQGWWDHLKAIDDFEFRSDSLGDESGRVQTFVGYDPAGYYLEWDNFIPSADNARLNELVRAGNGR